MRICLESRRGFRSHPLASFCIFFTGKPRRLVSPRLRLCLEIPQRIQIVSSGLVLYPLHRRSWSVGFAAVAHLLVDPAEESNRILWPRSVASSPPSPIGWSRRGCAFVCRSRRRIQIVSSGLVLYPLPPPSLVGWSYRACAFAWRSRRRIQIISSGLVLCLLHR